MSTLPVRRTILPPAPNERRKAAFLGLAILGLSIPALLHAGTEPEVSSLWGTSGESWTPSGRLPDFSLAGYHQGVGEPPVLPAGRSARDFGAKGDGIADDTDALERALREVTRGAIELPAGRYRVTRPLTLRHSGVVLRGAGADRTVLVCPTPLNDIEPNWGATTTGQRTSNYSWSGGFLRIEGANTGGVIADITAPASRGETVVRAGAADKVKPGEWVEVLQTDTPDNSLARHLYDGDSGPVGELKGRSRASLIARVERVEGDLVHINRPLRTDIRPEWKPHLRAFQPTVTESGIEHLSVEFPLLPYRGHFTEVGYNLAALSGVAHCWLRDVHARNADSGVFVSGWFNTVTGLVLESDRKVDGQGCTGHHGVSVGGSDNWVTGFNIRTRFIHDLTVSGQTCGNVFSRGRAVDLSLDHHRRAPYENLFTHLDAGAGTRLWKCGGGADLGKHCGARGTFWGIASRTPIPRPPPGFGPPSLNVVGVPSTQPAVREPTGHWFDPIPPALLYPPDLHLAQRAARRAGESLPTSAGKHESGQ